MKQEQSRSTFAKYELMDSQKDIAKQIILNKHTR